MLDDRESIAHMISEFVRDVAVLILVFVPLDYLLKSNEPKQYPWLGYTAVVAVSLLLLALGIAVERRRHPAQLEV